LFGVSPPLAKLLLPEAGPLLIAGLLYMGAGLGLLVFEILFYRGVVGALLLNLEVPFTIGLAMLFFREHLGRRELAGCVDYRCSGHASGQTGRVAL
jgi:drug/metabolite transporter (DMT)-like permease